MKALTKDKFLVTFKSVSKADPAGGEVRSICEKLYPGVGNVLSWIPNGSLLMGCEDVKVKATIKYLIFYPESALSCGRRTVSDTESST
jgi:hypothetical protein